MTPVAIVREARSAGIDIIGITDHNSTLQGPIVKEVGEREGLVVLCGAEITTKEEVHLLAFVEGKERLSKLQAFLSENLIKVKNNPDLFGYQLVIDADENVLYQEENLLIGAIDKELDECVAFIHSLEGIAVAAHIDKRANSLLSQLGFIPPSLAVDGLELSPRCNIEQLFQKHPYIERWGTICSSDAHYLEEIGRCKTKLPLESYSFAGVKEAITKCNYNNFMK